MFQSSVQDFEVFILFVKVSFFFPECVLWLSRLSRCFVRREKACDQIILGTNCIILMMIISM